MKADFRPKPGLGTVKIEEFHGKKKKFNDWWKTVMAQKRLYQLEDTELSMLIFLSCKDDARETLNIYEIDELEGQGGFAKVKAALFEAYGGQEDEKFEEAEDKYNSHRRTPGMTMDMYVTTLKKLKIEYLKQDPESVISDKAYAQRMLNRSGLSKSQRHTVFFNAGGKYVSGALEKVLKHMHQKIHEDESSRGRVATSSAIQAEVQAEVRQGSRH